jgi:large conductance mechanosensitive channel
MDPIKRVTDPLRHAAESEPVRRVADHLHRAAGSEPARKAASLAGEFRRFAFKGNVVDLAIGVIIGAAFGKVIDALVKSVIMPLVGVFLPGEEGYRGWVWHIRGQEVPYGQFLGETVNFLIVALVLFLFLVKFLGWITRSKEESPPPPTREQELLAEIRDLLRARAPAAEAPPPPPTPG